MPAPLIIGRMIANMLGPRNPPSFENAGESDLRGPLKTSNSSEPGTTRTTSSRDKDVKRHEWQKELQATRTTTNEATSTHVSVAGSRLTIQVEFGRVYNRSRMAKKRKFTLAASDLAHKD